MKRWTVLFAATLATLMMSAVGVGAPQSKGEGHGQARAESSGVAVFGSVEVRIIREWFGNPHNVKGLPPGLAKKEGLPPGLAKQLRKNGSLPPGLQKRIQPLPHDLEVRLPRRTDGHKRVIIAGAVVLIDEKLGRILDVLADVI